MNRRHFLHTTALGLAVAASPVRAAAGPRWPIGTVNRPWVNWSIDEMLDGVKSAGYSLVGLQTTTAKDAFASSASPEYLATLKQKIAARGLKANVVRLRVSESMPFDKASAEIRRQMDNARTLGVTAAINTGTGRVEHYDNWYRQMAYAAATGAERGVQLVIKPHGGVIGDAADILKTLEKINHANVGVWYDPGNIIFYTGKDPLPELEPIIRHVTAFTAKDCTAKGGEVMIQLGAGKVDFPPLLRRLQKAGFKGPIMLEGCAVATTAAATTANARANREFVEAALARL